jgi:hypothetical protein
VLLRRRSATGSHRNRLRPNDFSEFESTGVRDLACCAVIDYATNYYHAVTVTAAARGADALACLMLVVEETERILGLGDLPARRGQADVIGRVGR